MKSLFVEFDGVSTWSISRRQSSHLSVVRTRREEGAVLVPGQPIHAAAVTRQVLLQRQLRREVRRKVRGSLDALQAVSTDAGIARCCRSTKLACTCSTIWLALHHQKLTAAATSRVRSKLCVVVRLLRGHECLWLSRQAPGGSVGSWRTS